MRNLTHTVILFGSAHQNLRKNGVSVKEKKNSESMRMQINRNRSPIPEDNSPKIRMPCQWWYSPALGVLNVECALGPLYIICVIQIHRGTQQDTLCCVCQLLHLIVSESVSLPHTKKSQGTARGVIAMHNVSPLAHRSFQGRSFERAGNNDRGGARMSMRCWLSSVEKDNFCFVERISEIGLLSMLTLARMLSVTLLLRPSRRFWRCQ